MSISMLTLVSHAQEQPVPQVEVSTLQPQVVRTWTDLSGRLTPVEFVQVRPQVGGVLQRIEFIEGALVEKGQLLLVIDPRPFEAAVSRAKANVSSAEAQAVLTRSEYDRAQDLHKKNLTSRSDYDARRVDHLVAEANIAAAEAALKEAQLNLEYAYIKAPVSGRISRAEITQGNVIEAGGAAPVLTTIVSHDRVYAEFDLDEQTYLAAVRQTGDIQSMPVELRLPGDPVIYQGQIHAFDNQLNTRSGTIRARAIFDNADGALVPGMYADVRLGAANEIEALMVSQLAVGTNQNQKFVYVVNQENLVAYRQVHLGKTINGFRIVKSGLKAGDKVIINGLQKVQPEMSVDPIESVQPQEHKLHIDEKDAELVELDVEVSKAPK